MSAPQAAATAGSNPSPKHSSSRAAVSSPAVDKAEVKKAHVCPPSTATHPRDRWETAFVYSFVKRFLVHDKDNKSHIVGLESAADLEEALLSNHPEPILEQILVRFVKNLRTKKGSVTAPNISHLVTQLVAEYITKPERSIFWNEETLENENPLADAGFFSAHWDVKLRVMRQLVEWQLSYYQPIRTTIDKAWGVTHNLHRKTAEQIAAERVPDDDPFSKKSLHMSPIGQDHAKQRYWVVDGSSRLYISTNPWKCSATFEAKATTLEEYNATIQKLKDEAPSTATTKTAKKWAEAHTQLIAALEGRVESIEQELQRIEKQKKKNEREMRAALLVPEARVTRARRPPDTNGRSKYQEEPSEDEDSDDDRGREADGDDYNNEREEDEEEDDGGGGAGSGSDDGELDSEGSGSAAPRRSRRAAVAAAKASKGKKRPSDSIDDAGIWQNEARRSTRQIAAALAAEETKGYGRERKSERERPSKRRRVTESPPAIELPANGRHYPVLARRNQPVKSNEKIVDQLPGGQKSKFWSYAIEVVDNSDAQSEAATDGPDGNRDDTKRRGKDESTENSLDDGFKDSLPASAASSRTSEAMDISDDDK